MIDDIQYDTSNTVIGGMNIAEAVESDKRLVFNESYTVSGARLTAPSIYACYDLTILGDVVADEIEVMGNLQVMGSIRAKRVSCLKRIFCGGTLQAETVSASAVTANDIKGRAIACSGNIIAAKTIHTDESLSTEKSVLTGEGILGTGSFSARNAVAAEFFDFDGEVLGKVLELDTDASFGTSTGADTLETAIINLKARISDELLSAGVVDEDRLTKLVGQLSDIDECLLSDWRWLLENIVALSYADRIANLRDYLMVVMAGKVLPQEIRRHEIVAHVFDDLLKNAEDQLDSLPFHARDVADFAYALKIVGLCEPKLELEKNEVLDRIFQSIGIKYKTVKSFLG